MTLIERGSWPQALATAGAAVIALRGLATWRRQQIGLRRQQVAEEVLLAAHGVREAMRTVRAPLIDAHEMRDDEGKLDMKQGEQRAYIRRWQRSSDAVLGLQRATLLAKIHFGKAGAVELERLAAILLQIRVAVGMSYHLGEPGTDPDFGKTLRTDLSWAATADHPDTVGNNIDRAINDLATRLRPQLLVPGERDPDAPDTRGRFRRWWDQSVMQRI